MLPWSLSILNLVKFEELAIIYIYLERSILKEIKPEYSLEGLMQKLKLQYFGHVMQRGYSLENALMLGKIEGKRRRGWQSMRWLDGIIDSMDMSLSKLWETLKDREVTHAAVLVVVKGKTLLSNYTATKNIRKQAVLWKIIHPKWRDWGHFRQWVRIGDRGDFWAQNFIQIVFWPNLL